jgi:hypothetical protein
MTSTRSLTFPPDPAAARLPAGASAPATPAPAAPDASVTWTAVVTADRAYYESVYPVNDRDAPSIIFPVHVPERRFPLSGTEVRIGRRSVSLGINPEIDLTGPPTDTAVSRLHAMLIAGPDLRWSVVDLGSPNGIQVNGRDVPSGEAVPLGDGARIHMGAWTMITITRADGA